MVSNVNVVINLSHVVHPLIKLNYGFLKNEKIEEKHKQTRDHFGDKIRKFLDLEILPQHCES